MKRHSAAARARERESAPRSAAPRPRAPASPARGHPLHPCGPPPHPRAGPRPRAPPSAPPSRGAVAAPPPAATPSTPAAPAPTPAPARALAIARALHGAEERWLRRGTRHTGTQGDLVLPVVQLGEIDEAPVGRLDHELREPREPRVLFVEVRVDLLH